MVLTAQQRTPRTGTTGEQVPLIRLEETPSTQDAVRELAARGVASPFAVAARHQSAGRGRLGRRWQSSEGASLTLSIACPCRLDLARLSAVPLLVGLAVIDALAAEGVQIAAREAGPQGATDAVGLKWPNDVMTADGRKLAGILVERDSDLLIVGIGVNILGPIELPDARPAAWLAGPGGLLAHVGPDEAAAVRARLEQSLADAVVAGLRAALSDAEVAAAQITRYTMICLTLGEDVAVRRIDPGLSGPPSLIGRAVDLEETGRLVLLTVDGARHAVDVGDVEHLRSAALGPRQQEQQEQQ